MAVISLTSLYEKIIKMQNEDKVARDQMNEWVANIERKVDALKAKPVIEKKADIITNSKKLKETRSNLFGKSNKKYQGDE